MKGGVLNLTKYIQEIIIVCLAHSLHTNAMMVFSNYIKDKLSDTQ